jgi:thiaminase
MFNSALLDKIGYLYQPRLYGFDDALAAVRCEVAGYASVFLPHIEIDHIDTGETAYQGWKEKHAGEDMAEYNRLKDAYRKGTRPIFEPATW